MVLDIFLMYIHLAWPSFNQTLLSLLFDLALFCLPSCLWLAQSLQESPHPWYLIKFLISQLWSLNPWPLTRTLLGSFCKKCWPLLLALVIFHYQSLLPCLLAINPPLPCSVCIWVHLFALFLVQHSLVYCHSLIEGLLWWFYHVPESLFL